VGIFLCILRNPASRFPLEIHKNLRILSRKQTDSLFWGKALFFIPRKEKIMTETGFDTICRKNRLFGTIFP